MWRLVWSDLLMSFDASVCRHGLEHRMELILVNSFGHGVDGVHSGIGVVAAQELNDAQGEAGGQ